MSPKYTGKSGKDFVSCNGRQTDTSWVCSYYDNANDATGTVTGTKLCSSNRSASATS